MDTLVSKLLKKIHTFLFNLGVYLGGGGGGGGINS